MARHAFRDVTTWVFDLDNTLYPPSDALFAQIEARMTSFICRELGLSRSRAASLRRDYWQRYGTTLAGLMAEHAMPPEPFLTEVHEVDVSVLEPDPALAEAVAALPGRRIVYTNGSEPYAREVLSARGLAGLFDAVFGVEHAGYRPKPEPDAFVRVFAKAGLRPVEAAMFEDDPRNLAVPHAMGLRCVHVAPRPVPAAPHVHWHTSDLAGFLRDVAP